MNVEKLAVRIRAEFEEAPGLVLTLQEASRFFGIDQDVMRSVSERLISAAALRWTERGALARAS